MPKQHIVHPNETQLIEEHRQAIVRRNQLAKVTTTTKEEADEKIAHLRVLNRVVSFTGQIHNARISKKSYAALNALANF